MENSKNRVFYYDVIRLIACLSVLTIHFNASFSAYSGDVFSTPMPSSPTISFIKASIWETLE